MALEGQAQPGASPTSGQRFDHFLAIDWSGAKGERHRGIALALATAEGGAPQLINPQNAQWSRAEVRDWLASELPTNTLIGADLGISLPFNDCAAFFPDWDESPPDAPSLWAMVDMLCADDLHLGAYSFLQHPEARRYFRHGGADVGDRFLLDNAATREGRFREAELAQRAQNCRPVSNFNLVGAAQVGKSSLTGMRMLHQLRGHLAVWPVDPLPEQGSVLVEIYTGLISREARALQGLAKGTRTKMLDHSDLDAALVALGSAPTGSRGAIDDHSSDALLSAAWLRKAALEEERWHPRALTPAIARTEGWTFGAY